MSIPGRRRTAPLGRVEFVGLLQGRAAPAVRPRSAAALTRGGRAEPLNTSVAVRNRGGGPGRQRVLTAMAVGPQAPPGSPPRPRQVIIPAGAVDENDTTVLDIPASSPLEQPQRILISPGTVRTEETMVVVVPAPRTYGYQQHTSPRYDPAAAAMAAAERERQEQAERVQRAKAAYLAYLNTRTDREAERLKYMLRFDQVPPAENLEADARRAERDLWGAEMPEVPDIDVDEPEHDPQPYRLLMSMNIEEYPPGAGAPSGGAASYQGSFSSPASMNTPSFSSSFHPSSYPASPGTPPWMRPGRFEEGFSEYGDLSDIEAPESLYGEDAGWEPPPPPAPLLAPPPEEENIIPQSPPRYMYQRPAPHDPDDLIWEWEEPPRPLYEIPILPEPEPYSAELFRLVRL